MMDRSFLRRYAASGAVIAGLYLLNRFLLVPLTSCRLLAWHGADFLAGGLMLCLLNGLLCLTRRRPVERALPAHITSLLRGFLLILPMAFLLAACWGMTGVWLAFPLTEAVTAALGAGFYALYARRGRARS